MKEYNVKIIVDNDELKMAFECDKEKNINCKGNGNCRECNYTTDAKYMKARQRDKAIRDKDYIIKLQDEIIYYKDRIRLLENINNQKGKKIKAYEDIFTKIIIEGKDIHEFLTINQIRGLCGLNFKKRIMKDKKEINLEAEEAYENRN